MAETQIQSAVPQKPADATAMREGDDGKMHFFNAAGTQGALAPDDIQKDDTPPASAAPVDGKPLFDMSKSTPISEPAGEKPLFDMSKSTPIAQAPDPMRGLSQATGLSQGHTSMWQRFRDFVQYGAPNGSFLAHDSSKVLQPGPEKDMQLMSPDALMTPAEQDRHPMFDETGKFLGALTTPQNVMMALGLGGAGKLPGLARPVVNLLTTIGFGAPIIQQAVAEVPEFKDAMLGNGQYADMSDEDRAHAAERILTRTTWGAAMLHELGQNAHAEGQHLGHGDDVHLDQNGNPVQKPRIFGPEEQPPQEPLADRIVKGAAKKVAGAAADVAQKVADKLQKSPENLAEAIGRTGDLVTAVTRASQISPKQYDEHVEKIKNVKEDLQAILNEHGEQIEGPKDFADKINEHIHEQEDKLQAIAGATKEDSEPVVPGIRDKIHADLDKFFDDNPQRYGSETDVRQAKADLMRKVMVESRGPNGIDYVEPNLLEAENTRRHLNPDINYNKNAPPVTDAYTAGAMRVAGKLREAIDQSYENKNVGKVKEWRTKEKDLIDVRQKLYDAQKRADEMGDGSLWRSLVNKVGKTSAITALLLGHFSGPASIPAAGLIVAGDQIRQGYKNPNVNVQRAIKISKKTPGAQTTEPTIDPGLNPPPGPTPTPAPVPAPYVPADRYKPSEKATTMSGTTRDLGKEFNTEQASRELERNQAILNDKTGRATEEDKKIATQRIAENREIALEIAAKLQKATAIDYATNAELASHYHEVVGATPPADLEKRFLGDLEKKTVEAQAANKPLVLDPDEQDLLRKINAAKARQNEASQQQAQKSAEEFKKNAEKAHQDAQKINEKLQQEKQAAAEKAKAEADALLEKQEAEKKEKEEAGLGTNVAPPFIPSDHLKLPGKWEARGLTGAHIAAHELGHQLMVAENGFSPTDIYSHLHPRVRDGVLGQAIWDSSPFNSPDGKLNKDYMRQNIDKFLDIMHGGPVAQEIASGVPMDQSYGKAGDLKQMKKRLTELGFDDIESARMMKQSEIRTREAMNTLGVPEILKRYTTHREAGLDEEKLMSKGAMGAAIEEYTNARGGGSNGTTDKQSASSGKDGGNDKGNDAGGTSGVPGSSKKEPRPAGKTGAVAGKGKRTGDGVKDEKLAKSREQLAKEMEALNPAPTPAVTPEMKQMLDDAKKENEDIITKMKEPRDHPWTPTEVQRTFKVGYGRASKLVDQVHPKTDLNPEANPGTIHPGIKEKTTGDAADDAAIIEGGGIPGGALDMQEFGRFRMFYEPETADTMAFKENEPITATAVRTKIAKKRAELGLKPVNDVQSELSKSRDQARQDRHAQTLRSTADEAQRIFDAPAKESLNLEADPGEPAQVKTPAKIPTAAQQKDDFKDWESTGPKTAEGMIERGNIDLTKRPLVHRKDGKISTLYSMSIGTPKGEVLIPRISPDGKVLSVEDAKALYARTGQHLGIFKDVPTADKFADLLHQKQVEYQKSRNNGNYNPTMETNE